jgi:GT2 family glycosyltransferase
LRFVDHPGRRDGQGSALSADQLTLVTVTHNSERELEALLGSVERFLPGAAVVVVDCASRDRSLAVARARPAVRAIELGENLGFGRGGNRGVAVVQSPLTVLVNPDVELLDDSLLRLGGEALSGPERLLAPLVLSPDGSRQETVHPAPCSAADLVRAVVPPAALPGRVGVSLAPWRSAVPRRVGWAVGCAVAARTDTLRRLGPFDERIFMYSEDLELGLRAAQNGVPTWFWPAARVLHHGGHSSFAAFGGEPLQRQAAARHDAVLRRLGPRSAAVDDAQQALTFASRIAYKRALRRPWARERGQLRALRAVRERGRGG